MVTKIAKNSLARRVASVAAVALLAVAGTSAVASAATTTTLTSEQQSQVSALTAKLLALAKAQSETASEGTYTGLFADALSGYDAAVIEAALGQVAGTPGLTPTAVKAATTLRRSYAANGATGATGATGGFGGVPSSGSPGFSGGGGGSNYGQ